MHISARQHALVIQDVNKARSDQLDCTQARSCALSSPLYALGSGDSSHLKNYALILNDGQEALIARLNLIRSAQHSIDIQTYIFDKDDSARLVLHELLAAARRGVHVRLLIDQMSAIEDLHILAALAGVHQNFRLRIYNPTFNRAKTSYLDYAASVVCCFKRFNQRMHNKLIVIDQKIGIVGGRNYQDDYFDWDAEYNFRDRDVLTAGSAATQMEQSFTNFWDAKRSVPVEKLNDVARYVLERGVPAMPPALYSDPDRVANVLELSADPDYMQENFVNKAMVVQHVDYLADLPGKRHLPKSQQDFSPDGQIYQLISSAKTQIMLQTPYLVLSRSAIRLFRKLQKRPSPPQIIVSTNSLATTDNPIVYTMSYKYKRRNVKDLGFHIYEYKPFPLHPIWYTQTTDASFQHVDQTNSAAQSSASNTPLHAHFFKSTPNVQVGVVAHRALRTESHLPPGSHNAHPLPVNRRGPRFGLHAKSLVIDDAVGVIGTHNFDPRSENYNTEGVVIIRDPDFAKKLAQSIDADIAPGNAWVVAPRRLAYASKASNASSHWIKNLWSWSYATDYAFVPGPSCSLPLEQDDPRFAQCYVPVGDFPDVHVGPKWLFVHMLSAFGAGLVPIL